LGGVAFCALGSANAEPVLAKRIVALAPSLTELVFAAGAEKSLVAVSAYSDYPEAARRLPQVADYAGVNIEALVALKPDLVLIWDSGTRAIDIARINEFRIRTEVVKVYGLNDVAAAIRRIGVLAGTSSVAEVAANSFTSRIARLSQAQQHKRPLTVFFELGKAPLATVNNEHVISQVIATCGGQNVFANAPALVFQPSREQLLQLNPEVILRGAPKGGAVNADEAVYDGLVAKQRNQIYAVAADQLLRPGPRLADAAEQVCMQFDKARRTAD
jgi:ABC-type Fe3+-hydroxamate transport system substrate-binding protein